MRTLENELERIRQQKETRGVEIRSEVATRRRVRRKVARSAWGASGGFRPRANASCKGPASGGRACGYA